MDRIASDAGVMPEDRTRVLQVAEAAMGAMACRTCSFATVGESPTLTMKLHDLGRELSARKALAPIARCSGVRDAQVHFPRTGYDAPLAVHVDILKRGKTGVRRYDCDRPVRTFFEKRMRAAGDLPGPLLKLADAVVTEVLTYSEDSLDLTVTRVGDDGCDLRFAGMRECSLSFLERLFDLYGRRIDDVRFESAGIERAATVRLIANVEHPPFPSRPEEIATESRKKPRLTGERQ